MLDALVALASDIHLFEYIRAQAQRGLGSSRKLFCIFITTVGNS